MKELLEKILHKRSQSCVHDPNSSNSTLIKSPRRAMVHPEIFDFYCPLCNGVYRFKKEGTTYVLVKD